MNSGQESKTSILENLSDLSYENKTTSKDKNNDSLNNTETIVNHNSKNTVDYIMNKKINNIEDYLDSRVINIYQRSWSKLEPKLKIKKLQEYFDNSLLDKEKELLDTLEIEDEINNSNTEVKSKKRKKGVEAHTKYDFNIIKSMLTTSDKKRLKINYNIEMCQITSIIVS
tara:strand:+ start:49 stop:558 length:510 start_codon:yes stop_codon:yes gene_type:complete